MRVLRPSPRILLASLVTAGTPLLIGADGDVGLLPLIVSGVSAVATYLVTIVFRVRAARKEARAKFLREHAQAQLADGDPTNDGPARETLLEAAQDEAEARVLNDVGERRSKF